MRVRVQRIASLRTSTLGALHLDADFCCFSLEDAGRTGPKVPGQTRIPAGSYAVELRTEGHVHECYKVDPRVSDIHRGVLWLQGVLGFEWIYIHMGNTDGDTDGCILVGDVASAVGRVDNSLAAYRRVYIAALLALNRGEPITVDVLDE